MKVLFITANRVGDAVLTTGLLAWLVEHYPAAQFTIACGPYGKDLFVATPRLERLIVMKKKKFNGHWISLWHQCAETKWDLIVDLRNSIVSRLLRAKRRAFYQGSTGKHKVVDNAGILQISPPPDPHIWITPEATREATRLLPSNNKPILALGPAANWPPKQWPVKHFVKFVAAMTASDGPLPEANVMIVADGHERDQIIPLLESISKDRRIEIIGQNLQTAAACIKHARLYVGNDSGLMHLSAALGTPTLGLFGPGFPEIYGPWGPRCALVRTPETRAELIAKLSEPTARSPNLMETLSVERALSGAKDLLNRTV